MTLLLLTSKSFNLSQDRESYTDEKILPHDTPSSNVYYPS